MTDTAQSAQQELARRLSAPFPSEAYKSFEGRGGRRFTYVADEAVMQRLDDVFGPEGWSLRVEPINDHCAKVAIEVVGVVREDFGYVTNADSPEPFKEAVSDGIRRVGRMFGIARDVYEGKVSPGGVRTPASAPRTAQEPLTDGVAAAQQVFGDDARQPQAGDPCPKHPDQTLRASRDGSGDLFHQDGEWPDGKKRWCSPFRPPKARR